MNRLFRAVAALTITGILLIPRASLCSEEYEGRTTLSSAALKPTLHPVLLLVGSPYDRGLAHGKQLKDQIHELVRLWKADIQKRYNADPDLFIAHFVQKTDYVTAIKKWAPEILDEIKGIGDGAEIDFNTMFVFQFVDEYWAQGERIAQGRCSSLGFSAGDGQPAYVAQTNDLETFRDGFQVVLRIRQLGSDLETLVHSNVGCIGWNGVNNKSIGICVNTVSHLDNCRDGLPVNCIVRGVLMQQSEADAIAFLKRIKHASGANYVVGGPGGVYCLECSAGKVVQFTPNGQDKVVWHTNHPLVNDDYNPQYKATLSSNQKIEGDENTIMVLSDQPTLYATFGPPDEAPYEQFSFAKEAK
jgi:predicted choloylglycine hydrolase